MGGSWPGAVDTANFGQKDFLVDYVRVWKFAQGTGPFTLVAQVQGQGNVSNSPDQATYPTFSKVALVATPASGWRFDHWVGGNGGARNPDTVVVAANDTVTAVFVPAGEQIGNGNFAQGLLGWSWWSDPTVGGGPTVGGNSACLHPASVGASNWMAQFSWLGLSLQLGEVYDLNFAARASVGRPLQVGLVQNHDPFGALSTDWTTTIGTSLAHFSHSFAATATDSVARLEFDFGTDTSTLCLDSVSLVREGASGIRRNSVLILAGEQPGSEWTPDRQTEFPILVQAGVLLFHLVAMKQAVLGLLYDRLVEMVPLRNLVGGPNLVRRPL